MDNVDKTLYIPLYGKAYVSQKGIILQDKKAEEIWGKENFKLKRKSKSKWLAYYLGMRSRVFDDWVKSKSQEMNDFVVINLGCGLDSRILRIENIDYKWYDIDFSNVIEKRKKYFQESSNYKMIGCDVRDNWLEYIPENFNAIILMEGISMYLSNTELEKLITDISLHFKNIVLLMDSYSVFAAKMSKYKNPVNDVNVSKVYGIDKPELFMNGIFSNIKEYDLTPKIYINELKSFEKFIFSKLYAGSFSKKLYKLYEYKNF